MTTSTLQQELTDARTQLMSLSTEQYHQMIEAGILVSGDPYELLDGVLVLKDRSKLGEPEMTVASHHAFAVQRLAALTAQLESLGCFMRTQNPVTFAPIQEPEPDGAIVLGQPADYLNNHPGPDDITCVIEVADASLRRDRTTKLRIYAQAGIRQYIIINLVEGVVEEHTQPKADQGQYDQLRTLGRDGVIEFFCAGDSRLPVNIASLLP